MSGFDPYHKWLGIPPHEQPPDHYRLLGIALFESDPEVIEAAADQRMAFVQQCAIGPHVDVSQKLLNELAAARICLLDPQKKADYDARLAAVQTATQQPEEWTTPLPAPPRRQSRRVPTTTVPASLKERPLSLGGGTDPRLWWLAGGGASLAVILLVVALIARRPGGSDPAASASVERTVALATRPTSPGEDREHVTAVPVNEPSSAPTARPTPRVPDSPAPARPAVNPPEPEPSQPALRIGEPEWLEVDDLTARAAPVVLMVRRPPTNVSSVPVEEPLGYRCISVVGIVPYRRQLEAFAKAINEPSQNVEQLLQYRSFQLERQRAVSGPDPWDGAWESVATELADEVLTNAADFEVDEVDEEITDPLLTMSPPKLALGTWGSLAIHPRIEDHDQVLLFRYLDFDVEPGNAYRYRVRLVLANPNFNRPLDEVVAPFVVEEPLRYTPWSQETRPVVVPRDYDYFVERIEAPRSRTAPLNASIEIFQRHPKYGTTINAKLKFEPGQMIGGCVDKTPVLIPPESFEDDAAEFHTNSLLVDLDFTPALSSKDHPELELSNANRMRITETALVTNEYGELIVLHPISQKEAYGQRQQLLELERQPFLELRNRPDRQRAAGDGDIKQLAEEVTGTPTGGSGSSSRFHVLWLRNSQNLAWCEHHDLTPQALTSLAQEHQQRRGLRPTCVTGYTAADGTTRFATVWIPDRTPTQVHFDLDRGSHQRLFDQMPAGFRPVWSDFYRSGDRTRAAVILAQQTSGPAWESRTNYRRDEFDQISQVFTQGGYRPALLGGHAGWDGDRRLQGLWIRDGTDFQAHLDLTSEEFRQKIDTLPRQYRPIWIDVDTVGLSPLYSLLAVRTNDRLDWTITSGLMLWQFRREIRSRGRSWYPAVVRVENAAR